MATYYNIRTYTYIYFAPILMSRFGACGFCVISIEVEEVDEYQVVKTYTFCNQSKAPL